MGNNIKKWIMAVAIAIVFNLFVNYGIATFYPSPEYSDYCNEPKPMPLREPQNCTLIQTSQEAEKQCNTEKGYIAYKYDSRGCATEEYCETCGAMYNETRKKHDGNAFIVLLIAASAALLAGVLIKAEAVSTGFLIAGVLGLIIAAIRYWEHLQNPYRFALLGIVLAVLVWLGYKKVK